MALERAPLLAVVIGDIDYERWGGGFIQEVVAYPFRSPGLALGRIPPKPAVERGFGQDGAGGDVVGVAIRPVRRRNDARPVAADERDGLLQVRGILTDATIGPLQVLAPCGS